MLQQVPSFGVSQLLTFCEHEPPGYTGSVASTRVQEFNGEQDSQHSGSQLPVVLRHNCSLSTLMYIQQQLGV